MVERGMEWRTFYLTHCGHFANIFGFVSILLLFPNLQLLGSSQSSQHPQMLSSFPPHLHLVRKKGKQIGGIKRIPRKNIGVEKE